MDIENNNIAIDEENEENPEMVTLVNFLKDNFTLNDFLNFQETRDILELQRRQKFDMICSPILEEFYISEIDYWNNSMSPLFINENNHKNIGCFIETVYSAIKPEYDLNIFYDNPSLARNMVETYEERMKKRDAQLRQERLDEMMKQGNIMKKYDWGNKKYK